MTRLLVLVVLCLAMAAVVAQAADVKSTETKPKAIRWAASLDAALQAAKTSGKPVFVDFYSDGCYYCKKMDRDVLIDAKIIALSTKFECAKVNTTKDKTLKDKYDVGPVPTFLFVDAKGKQFYSTVGYMPIAPFSAKLTRALELFKTRDELAILKEKYSDDEATPIQLGRLAYLLWRLGEPEQARQVVTLALEGLPETDAATVDAKLTMLLLETRRGSPAARDGVEAWIAANIEAGRRWEAQYELGLAQANADELVKGAKTLTEVAQRDPGSEFGTMAAYYSAAIDEVLNCSTTGGG